MSLGFLRPKRCYWVVEWRTSASVTRFKVTQPDRSESKWKLECVGFVTIQR